MTLREAQRILRELGMSLRKVDREYQVKPAGMGSWQTGEQVYYTDDLQDAYETGKRISYRLGSNTRVIRDRARGGDSFRREDIALFGVASQRARAPSKPKRLVTRFVLMLGDGSGIYNSTPLTEKQAEAAVRAAQARGLDVYAASMQVRK